MATIKSYTDLEQSRKLAAILPLESADMYWSRCTITDFGDGVLKVSYTIEPCNISQFRNTKEDIPCWSLSALLGVLPTTKGKDTANPFIAKTPDNEYYVVYTTLTKEVNNSATYDNPIDACYNMIIHLHKLNVL